MNIVLLGVAGSGKGTQASLICKQLNLYHFMMGYFARKEAAKTTEFGLHIKKTLNNGHLLDHSTFSVLLNDGLKNEFDTSKYNGIVFDGVVRTKSEAEILDNEMKNSNYGNINHVIEISVRNEIIEDRILNRIICKNCNESFSKKSYTHASCRLCQSTELIVRSDDNLDALKNRIKGYFVERTEILDYYKEKNTSIHIINGEESADLVFSSILNCLKI